MGELHGVVVSTVTSALCKKVSGSAGTFLWDVSKFSLCMPAFSLGLSWLPPTVQKPACLVIL